VARAAGDGLTRRHGTVIGQAGVAAPAPDKSINDRQKPTSPLHVSVRPAQFINYDHLLDRERAAARVRAVIITWTVCKMPV